MKEKTTVGGQAVIEGVMMRGRFNMATAVRKSNGEIEVEVRKNEPYCKRNKLFSLPLIRGFVTLLESLVEGIKALNYSASFFEEEVKEEDKLGIWFKKIFKDKSDDVITGISLFISLIFAFGLFFALPTLAARGLRLLRVTSPWVLNLAEGLIGVLIFLTYIFVIGKLEDIKRVFEYHGAEHKTIFCYESGMELTPENAKKFSRLHPRCGTNFMFLVIVVSILVFSLVGWNNLIQRLISRLLLLPLISGIAYELIKWLGKNNGPVAKVIGYPGLMLQKLTTREPDIEQLEVAIAALKAAEGIEDVPNIEPDSSVVDEGLCNTMVEEV